VIVISLVRTEQLSAQEEVLVSSGVDLADLPEQFDFPVFVELARLDVWLAGLMFDGILFAQDLMECLIFFQRWVTECPIEQGGSIKSWHDGCQEEVLMYVAASPCSTES
jgi:hypothetical protein